jgi:nicotinic acid mononucleotide adenylyltransferase
VAFTFGRFNPPTIGHVLLIDKVKDANPSDYRVYLSHTVDKKKNPLTYDQKIEFITSIAPHHSDRIIQSQSKTIFNIMVELYNDGYKDVILVVGSDRVDEFAESLNKYNGVESKHGLYSFDNIIVKSAGVRDPDSDGVEGISASKMRQAVLTDDVETFKLGLPSDYDHTTLWNALKCVM